MEDMLNKEIKELVLLLEDQGISEIRALDIRENSSWTDILVIGTVTSRTQALGAEKKIKEFLHQHNRTLYNGNNKGEEGGWILLDCGNWVINLMTKESRDFYQLEELWFEAETIG